MKSVSQKMNHSFGSVVDSQNEKRILAISSGGGHWVQLLRLLPILERHRTVYVTVSRVYQEHVPSSRFHVIRDATWWNKVGLVMQFVQIVMLILWYRPDVVISTGAAPGYFAVRLGKMIGAKTIWLDSIANSEELSSSGQRIGKHVNLWLTQWEHLSEQGGPFFGGKVL